VGRSRHAGINFDCEGARTKIVSVGHIDRLPQPCQKD
jgi:hypothetical protein